MTAQLLLPRLRLKLVDIPQVFSHNLLFNTGNVIQALLLSLQVDLKHLLPKIKAPCLLVWSEKDLTEPTSIAREMAAFLWAIARQVAPAARASDDRRRRPG